MTLASHQSDNIQNMPYFLDKCCKLYTDAYFIMETGNRLLLFHVDSFAEDGTVRSQGQANFSPFYNKTCICHHVKII